MASSSTASRKQFITFLMVKVLSTQICRDDSRRANVSAISLSNTPAGSLLCHCFMNSQVCYR